MGGGSGAGGEEKRQIFPTENVEKWGFLKIESVNSTSFSIYLENFTKFSKFRKKNPLGGDHL